MDIRSNYRRNEFFYIGIFDNYKLAISEKNKWKSIKEIKFEIIVKRRLLNKINPNDFLNENEVLKIKPIIRDFKINEILN